jgi:hypothetical protein
MPCEFQILVCREYRSEGKASDGMTAIASDRILRDFVIICGL